MDNPYVRPLPDPITLSTGAIVVFSYMTNGAQSANIAGRAMTEAEYVEFLNIINAKILLT